MWIRANKNTCYNGGKSAFHKCPLQAQAEHGRCVTAMYDVYVWRYTHVGQTDTHRNSRTTSAETGVQQPCVGAESVSNSVPGTGNSPAEWLSVESRGRVDKCEPLTQLCVLHQFEIQGLFKEGETKPKQRLIAVKSGTVNLREPIGI